MDLGLNSPVKVTWAPRRSVKLLECTFGKLKRKAYTKFCRFWFLSLRFGVIRI